jgi:hypothetical protein
VSEDNWLDWLDFELGEHKDWFHNRAREPYLAAYSILEKEHLSSRNDLESKISSSIDEEDARLSQDIINYEESRWTEQREALAGMALALLGSVTKSFLDLQKQRTDKTHPANPAGYSGKSELHRLVSEFKSRFGVDLGQLPYFATVREVALARNCCLHNEGALTHDYRSTEQRLVEGNKINLTPETLDMLIEELSAFGDSLNQKMREIRRQADGH